MTHNNSHPAMYGDEVPVAAFATTPGKSALTLIRCSGKGSIDFVSSVFMSANMKNSPLPCAAGNSVLHGWIVKNENKEKIDDVLVSVFRAPKSYTGEDSLDICCHGGITAGKAVMDALISAGFRGALPGEFTFRAFMNGNLDLTQCESVMELVSAKTEESRRHAVSRLSGSLEKEINEIKQMLVQALAGAEIYLDYSEDEIGEDAEEDSGRLPNQEIAANALLRLKKLSASWRLERVYQEGVTVAVAGLPNAGKSSLFNSLLKEDRSIVTEMPGTTRDWIEAHVSADGIPLRLVDTAGLRETSDCAEKIGVERSQKMLREAEIVLYLIDSTRGVTEEDQQFILEKSGRCILVWSKLDLVSEKAAAANSSQIYVSAKTGEGIEELYAAIVTAVKSQFDEGMDLSASLGTARQKKLVDNACSSLEEALVLADKEEPLDLIAPLLRDAVNSLGEITGEVSTFDILAEMFSGFCVGK